MRNLETGQIMTQRLQKELDSLLTFSMKQLITEPIHILENTSICIDLIFTNHPPPPSYTREIWDYKKTKTDLINRSIENVDWSNMFMGKNAHEQVEIFKQAIINIFHNFIPNKTVLSDD